MDGSGRSPWKHDVTMTVGSPQRGPIIKYNQNKINLNNLLTAFQCMCCKLMIYKFVRYYTICILAPNSVSTLIFIHLK